MDASSPRLRVPAPPPPPERPAAPWWSGAGRHLPGALGGLLLVGLGTTFAIQRGREAEARHARLVSDAETAATQVSLHLEGTRDFLQLLAEELGRGELDPAEFQARATAHVLANPEVINVTWADADWVIRWASPEEPNRQVIGLRLDLPEPARASRAARDAHAAVWTDPFVVLQGGPAIEVYVPVFAGNTFAGTVSGVFSLDGLLAHAIPPQLGREYAVSLLDPEETAVATTRLDGPDLGEELRVPLRLHGSAASLSLGAYRSGEDPVAWIVGLATLGLAGVMTIALSAHARALEDHRRTEQALRASEERTRGLVNASGDLIFTLDRAGRILDVNPVFERITGWPRAEWIGRELVRLLHPDDAAIGAGQLRQVEAGEPAGPREVRLRAKDGAMRHFEVALDPRLTDGERVGTVAIARDVTVRRRAEALLERELAQARVLEGLSGALAGPMPLGEAIQRVSEAARQLLPGTFGLAGHIDPSSGEMFASCCGDAAVCVTSGLLDWVRARSAPLLVNSPVDDVCACRAAPVRRLLAVPARCGEEVLGVVAVGDADADYVEADLHRLQHVADLLATVVQRHRASQALAQSEQHARAIMENAAEPIYIVGDRGSILDANPAASAAIGYTREELRALTVFDLDPTAGPDNHPEVWARILDGQTGVIHGVHTRKDGSRFPVAVHVSKLPGAEPRMLGVIHDLTEHRRTEQMLEAIARGIASQTGARFFLSLAEFLHRHVPGAPTVFVGELIPAPRRVRSLALVLDGAPQEPLEYDLEGTPCAETMRAGEHVCTADVAGRFPGDPWLAQNRFEAYLGLALQGSDGRVLGVLSFLFHAPLADPLVARSMANIFATRAAAELERTQAETALARERSFLQQVVDGVSESILVVAPNHEVLLANRAARADSPLATARGAPCYQVTHGRDAPCDIADCPLSHVERTRRAATVVHQHRGREGDTRFVEVDATPLLGGDGGFLGIIKTARDVTERKRAEDELRERSRLLAFQATHDRLTGLPNRALFHDRLRHAIAKSRRGGTRVALLFVDLDRFKPVNDTLGHDVGDGLLQVIARRLRLAVREGDTVARLGGDEFVVLLEGLAEAMPAAAVARKLLDSVAAPVEIAGHEVQVGASVGIALSPGDGADEEGLVRAADAAMYLAKEHGGGAFRFHGEADQAAAQVGAWLDEAIQTALAEDQIGVVFQPVVDLETRAILGFEALARWSHPERGAVPPDVFVPAALRAGVVSALEERVLRVALGRMRAWDAAGIAPPWISINLTEPELCHGDPGGRIRRVLAECGWPADRLMIEVGEGVLAWAEGAGGVLEGLASAGVRVVLDDFGAGAVPLARLRRFPLHAIKVDRTFLAGLGEDPGDTGVITGILGLAAGLGVQTIGEGVEREEQRRFLVAHGCRVGQGYLFAPPLSQDEAERLLHVGHA